jgi:hypothetical protein
MPSVYDTLYNWARKTTTSFGELRFLASQRDEAENDDGDSMIYRLRYWPELPTRDRTADVFRALSVMSTRPINRRWILAHSKLRAEQVDQLLLRLIGQGAVEVIDGSKFAAGAPLKAACPAR